MCTSIVEIAGAEGAGRSMDGWFSLTHSVVAYDHPQHALLEEAVTIDFLNPTKGAGARGGGADAGFCEGASRGSGEGHRGRGGRGRDADRICRPGAPQFA